MWTPHIRQIGLPIESRVRFIIAIVDYDFKTEALVAEVISFSSDSIGVSAVSVGTEEGPAEKALSFGTGQPLGGSIHSILPFTTLT